MSIRSALVSAARSSLLLLCALCAVACASPGESPSTAKENAAMTATPPLAEPSGFTAQDLCERVLALIQNVRGIGDLAPEKLREATGLPIVVHSANDYGANGPVAGVWYYGLRSMSPDAAGTPNRVLFQLNDQSDSNADMSPVCVPFEIYEKTLVSAGFASKKLRNRHNTQDYWQFTRDNVGATVYVRGKSDPSDAQACVSMVIVEIAV